MRFFLFLLVFLISQITNSQSLPVGKKDLRKLYAYMAGEFSSEAQATSDSTFFHVKLRMVPIWPKQKDGCWLYVEQAIATSEDKPYRQRVYHVFGHDDTTIVSQVYEIKNPLQYAGGWKDPSKLAPLAMDSLISRQGCGIYLHKQPDGSFSGSTPGKQCLSSMRGATYATSEVTIYPDKVLSWDRGWDAHDIQVWGAVKAGYVFVKEKKYKT
jgi:hypothetical protein